MRDFDLVDDSGIVVHAVEVTSVQLGAVRATRTALKRLHNAELGLSSSWSVTVHEAAEVRPLERQAPPLLNLLHSKGITDFNYLRPPADASSAEAVARLASLHVPAGFLMATAPTAPSVPRRLWKWGARASSPRRSPPH